MDATVRKYLQDQTQKQLSDRQNGLEAKINRLSAAVASKGAPGLTLEAMNPVIKEIAADMADLKRRMATLEARPQVKYMGVHKPGATYSEGSLVTRDGSIFHCNKTTTAMPGDGSQDWQLAVKRGKDAVS
jgi:hypothetical protein